VDGPLVCLKLDHNPYIALRVTVGSLCGYVCQLTYNHQTTDASSPSWEGPFMVVQDLWNSLLDEEDAVLAVDAHENFVVVGTHVGRCILYATKNSETFFPVWDCLLPYSVHGIKIVQPRRNESESLNMKLSVTTRRSYHLFQAVRCNVEWEHRPPKTRYNAGLASARLTVILNEMQKRNREEDQVTKAIVAEILRDILNRVEETVQLIVNPIDEENLLDVTHEDDAASIVSSTLADLLNRVDLQLSDQRENSARQGDSERSFSSRGPQLEYSSSDDDYDGRVVSAPTTVNSQISSTVSGGFSQSETVLQDDEGNAIGQFNETTPVNSAASEEEEYVIVIPPVDEGKDESTS
jgi:hypothetical protein